MDQGLKESLKRKYRRKLVTSLCLEDDTNLSLLDSPKAISIKVVVYTAIAVCTETSESSLIKSWRKLFTQEQSEIEETLLESEKIVRTSYNPDLPTL